MKKAYFEAYINGWLKIFENILKTIHTFDVCQHEEIFLTATVATMSSMDQNKSVKEESVVFVLEKCDYCPIDGTVASNLLN